MSDSSKGLSIGIIVPFLNRMGGMERFVLRTVAHWQHEHRLTVYSRAFDHRMLAQHGIQGHVELRALMLRSYGVEGVLDGTATRLLDAAMLPGIWERQIEDHDVYVAHQWPSQLVDRHPMVWYPHEAPRDLYDLNGSWPSPRIAHEFRPVTSEPHVVRRNVLNRHKHRGAYHAMGHLDALGRPDRVVANSRFTAANLEQVYGRPVDDVVYPGVDLEELPEPTWDEDLFLCVGSLADHKRVRLAIEALSLVPEARLCVVGQGPAAEALEAMAAALGVEDRVEIRGRVSDRELRALYARCLAGVFVPVREPFGIVPLETLAAGKPLVAVAEGGFTEVVDRSCTLLVPPEPGAIARQMRFLMGNRDVARQMGQAGRKLASKYSWHETAARFGEIVEETHRDWVRGASAATRPAARLDPVGRPRVGVHYFGGYGDGVADGRWRAARRRAERLDMPEAGYYASYLPDTAAAHVELLAASGVDFLVVNLHLDDRGADALELATLQQLRDVVAERPDAPELCVQLNVERAPREAVERVLDFVRSLAREGGFLSHEGRPVLLTGADGLRPKLESRAARDFRLVPTPTAAPGDARPDADRPRVCGVTLDDSDGSFPDVAGHDWVLVSSFNDYARGTHFEPSRDHGSRRLERLQAWLQELSRA